MLPIILKNRADTIGLAGRGEALERRRQWLASAGIEPSEIAATAPLRGLKFLFVAGVDREQASGFVARAHAQGILVHVEDDPSLCDFYAPAIVRRGDLTISVSTAGKAPALARLLREWLDVRFGSEWARHVQTAGEARAELRNEGATAEMLAERTRELASRLGWLA